MRQKIKPSLKIVTILTFLFFISFGCTEDEQDNPTTGPLDPDSAPEVSVDRFSDAAGTLMVRSSNGDLPAENEPINFDNGFITQSFGPDGQVVKYYNFDVQPLTPAPIYVLFREGATEPVEEQLNIIDVIPGDLGYNDFWQIIKVTVPEDYEANTVTSAQEIFNNQYSMESTPQLVNCPVVPKGSTANLRYGDEASELDRGWYKSQVVYYFTFMEKALETNASDEVPISPIYVTFNINPDDNNPDSGPASGFMTEQGTAQTHNVVATVPTNETYSPLWSVNVYDNADFSNVSDLSSAQSASILGQNLMYVNCPVVYEETQ